MVSRRPRGAWDTGRGRSRASTANERWAALPSQLARERGLSRVEEGADDIADPYHRPQEAFEQMAVEVDAAVERIVAFEASFD